jgi:anti-sigma28 factor (negative regulator of flagellin synthesis)
MASKDDDKRGTVKASSGVEIDLPVDEQKVKEIQACLAKGRLKISVTKVDLASGRLGNGYLYD